MTDSPREPLDPVLLREAMARRLFRRSVVEGQIVLPAVPGMIDEYMAMCDQLFAAVGRRFTGEQLAHARTLMESQLNEAFDGSQRSSVVISFKAPVGVTLDYHVRPQWWTVEAAYENWIEARRPPLFGSEPDARVVALADEAPDPATHRVLDIGAGTGRNALPLARRGHLVDVVEMTPKFADIIRRDAEAESLDVRVIQRDVFSTLADLRRDYQLIVLSEVFADFRTTDHVRSVFELAGSCLAPGGRLVFNVLVTRGNYVPDDAARQLAQQSYSNFFTRAEISAAAVGLPLELVSDVSAYDYEKANLPEGAWPPTGWYEGWASGLDVFDVAREDSPIELRWLVYEKTV